MTLIYVPMQNRVSGHMLTVYVNLSDVIYTCCVQYQNQILQSDPSNCQSIDLCCPSSLCLASLRFIRNCCLFTSVFSSFLCIQLVYRFVILQKKLVSSHGNCRQKNQPNFFGRNKVMWQAVLMSVSFLSHLMLHDFHLGFIQNQFMSEVG